VKPDDPRVAHVCETAVAGEFALIGGYLAWFCMYVLGVWRRIDGSSIAVHGASARSECEPEK
jgi:hypothetical protein